MGTYASTLDKAAPEIDPFAALTATVGDNASPNGCGPYTELATRLFGRPPSPKVVAFASVNRSEGVTRTVRGLAAELAQGDKLCACLNGDLRGLQLPGLNLAQTLTQTQPLVLGAPCTSESYQGIAGIARLRDRYDAVLLDCGALESSLDLLRLAPAADGVVLIVEAGRTRKHQIDRAAQMIAEAQGTLLGFVLNKRRYPIPNWLYRFL